MGDRRDWRVLPKKRFQRRSLCQGNDQALPADERVQQNQAGLLISRCHWIGLGWFTPTPCQAASCWFQVLHGHGNDGAHNDLVIWLGAWLGGHRVQILLSSGDGLDLDGVDWGHAELLLDLPLMDCLPTLQGRRPWFRTIRDLRMSLRG